MRDKLGFKSCYQNSPYMLMEGALGERLKREYNIIADEEVALAAHIYKEESRQALKELFNRYINIAKEYDFPIMITTPTRRVNKDRVEKSKYDENIIFDNVNFLKEVSKEYASSVYVGGLMGCKGDAYKVSEVLEEEEAEEFHSWQANLFKEAKVDFLFAGIMPALSEAIGMAKAMEETELPYIISFMIGKDGKLLDGTTINDAIYTIDNKTKIKPLFYMTNCVHPKVLHSALLKDFNRTDLIRNRFKGIQANTSALSPEELDNREDLKSSDPDSLAKDMRKLCEDFNINVLGGCCGTDHKHIKEIAEMIKDKC